MIKTICASVIVSTILCGVGGFIILGPPFGIIIGAIVGILCGLIVGILLGITINCFKKILERKRDYSLYEFPPLKGDPYAINNDFPQPKNTSRAVSETEPQKFLKTKASKDPINCFEFALI